MEASNANTIPPPLLTLIQLRWTMSDSIEVNGLSVRVADDVPTYRIITVELAMNKPQRDLYRPIHKSLSKMISGGGKSEVNEGHLNQGTHRLLCHARFMESLFASWLRCHYIELSWLNSR